MWETFTKVRRERFSLSSFQQRCTVGFRHGVQKDLIQTNDTAIKGLAIIVFQSLSCVAVTVIHGL